MGNTNRFLNQFVTRCERVRLKFTQSQESRLLLWSELKRTSTWLFILITAVIYAAISFLFVVRHSPLFLFFFLLPAVLGPGTVLKRIRFRDKRGTPRYAEHTYFAINAITFLLATIGFEVAYFSVLWKQ